ncbi:hypothetical protein [Rhodopirellula halodulae]|uniref:hypothetical protein n=1 Tax=Rhodopirellula halodulae TaxID=2894198 RepID=UPI001E40402E|nr:hypothetical protein [Rhodopirellula sp. JC737]MCC9658841.1 hypothetical protein [Rhodopirellula sp. JC737]
MLRREFARLISLGTLGGLYGTRQVGAAGPVEEPKKIITKELHTLAKDLLSEWCDGMLRRQIRATGDITLDGALRCDACAHLHGRCSDALYPFLKVANTTKQPKYLDAAVAAFDWAENNVSREDGSWTTGTNPRSWRGTSIFGAIARAEALHYHGEMLDESRRNTWLERLDRAAGGYLYSDFRQIDFTNLNYGMTAVYGFHLFGRLLNDPKYTRRSEQLAASVKEFFTEPNRLLWGEGKPNDNRSGRGLPAVDLGYNVEESLNGLVLYALDVNDVSLLEFLTKSLEGHLQFMLPDGAWDNSWGTRSAKWSYWGSRTTDGCQPAYALMADRNPAFETAALRNAELLKRCTSDGLLHGGPHYVSHQVAPCVHHTFAHAKAMALLLDKTQPTETKRELQPLPRLSSTGVKHFPELDVWLASKGPWRATVSAYDSIYKTKSTDHIQQPTGGSLALLYHTRVGTVLASSMARYLLVEPLNQQPQPGQDFPLTTRIERRLDEHWYTNLYDLEATVTSHETGKEIRFEVATQLQDEDRQRDEASRDQFQLNYCLQDDRVQISASPLTSGQDQGVFSLVVPIISPSGETVRFVSKTQIEIEKPEGRVVCSANVPLRLEANAIDGKSPRRIFNMVPGMEALPIIAEYSGEDLDEIRVEISVV